MSAYDRDALVRRDRSHRCASMRIGALGFDAMPTRDAARGTDGEGWILERSDGSTYHVVSRWTPGAAGPKAAFRNVCLHCILGRGAAGNRRPASVKSARNPDPRTGVLV